MTVEQHIQALLARYGRAYVPGLGLFVTTGISARQAGARLLPPGAEVSFIAGRTAADTSLAEALMQEQGLTYAQAQQQIAQAIATIDPERLTGPARYLPANFGLAPIALPAPVRKPLFAEVGRAAAILAAALLLNTALPTAKIATTSEAGFVPQLAERVMLIKPEPEPEPAAEAPRPFCVIVASLANREQANAWLRTNKRFAETEVIESEGRYRMAAARFATYAEAQAYIKAQAVEAWVLKTAAK